MSPLLAFLLLILLLPACSGGGDSGPPPPNAGGNQPPGPGPAPVPSSTSNVIFGRSTNANLDIFLSKIDGTGVVTLAADSTISERFYKVVGSKVIYHTSPVGPLVPRDIWAVNLDGTGVAPLVNTGADEFASGVTATRVVYGTSQSIGGLRDLGSVGVDGTAQRVLANSGDDEYFRDVVGERVIYERRVGSQAIPQSNNTDIYSINADGTDLRPIATTLFEEFDQATVGNQIIFVRRVDPSSLRISSLPMSMVRAGPSHSQEPPIVNFSVPWPATGWFI